MLSSALLLVACQPKATLSSTDSSISTNEVSSSEPTSTNTGSNASGASFSWPTESYDGDYYAKIDATAKGDTLRGALATMLNASAFSIPSYANLKTTLPKSDLDPNGSGSMLGFYDETKLPTSWDDQATWNREHVWPKSWGDLGTDGPGADPHMVRPCSVHINSGRGNDYYGLASDSNSSAEYMDPGQYLEKYRGIAARICFYMATRYWKTKNLNLAETPTANCMGKKSRLLEWNKQYPVDATEIKRNEVLFKLYNVRNPFIDHPSWAAAIWEA